MIKIKQIAFVIIDKFYKEEIWHKESKREVLSLSFY